MHDDDSLGRATERAELHESYMHEHARRYDGLKSVATSAHVALKEALPYVHSNVIQQRMKDVLERLALWGAHP